MWPSGPVNGVTPMNNYKAFGCIIHSDFPIPQLPAATGTAADITIRRRDLRAYKISPDHYRINAQEICFALEAVGTFRVAGGSSIEVDPDPACPCSHMGVYLMGSCMGAVLHQRGFLPLHGSCVTDGARSILIAGDSGAGKSTLAAEFLKRGWKLITDDVTAVFDVESTPMVQSSYPSQKLWQDALDRYGRPGSGVHSLYFSDKREKFCVNVSRFFHEGTCPLSLVVRLLPADAPTAIHPIEGMTQVDQLLRNTYRSFMIDPKHRQRHFQRCVTLSAKVPMALAIRERGAQSAHTLYELITDYLGGMNHA